MRDREYLIAIFARDGILCAETLRFSDELRDPESIGLPAPGPSEKSRVAAFERSIDALSGKTISGDCSWLTRQPKHSESTDREEEKGRSRRDTRRMMKPGSVDAEDEDQVDLLETIRQSLRHSEAGLARVVSPRSGVSDERPRTRKDAGSTWSRQEAAVPISKRGQIARRRVRGEMGGGLTLFSNRQQRIIESLDGMHHQWHRGQKGDLAWA